MINDEFTHSKFNNSKFYMYNAAGQKPRTMEYARTATPRRGSFGEYAAYSPDAERSRSMAINARLRRKVLRCGGGQMVEY